MEQTAKEASRLYIYRNKSGRFWWCAIPYVDRHGYRKQRRKTFRDARYGSEKAAFLSAKAWRDDALKDPAVIQAQGGRYRMQLVTVEDPEDVDFTGNPFGLSGITVAYRAKQRHAHISVTANRGRKKWFSMHRYGPKEAFRLGVRQRCKWLGIPYPGDMDPVVDLELRFWHWAENHIEELHYYGLNP